MAMRPPLQGFNHKVRHAGQFFHAQTEDSGVASHHVTTQLFFAGRVVASKRFDYAPDQPESQVIAAMQAQHKAILLELRAGRYDTPAATLLESAPLDAPLVPITNEEAALPDTKRNFVIAHDAPILDVDDELALLEARLDDLDCEVNGKVVPAHSR